jgi:hypothetical protein
MGRPKAEATPPATAPVGANTPPLGSLELCRWQASDFSFEKYTGNELDQETDNQTKDEDSGSAT